MHNKIGNLLCVLMFCLILIPMVSSAPPFLTTGITISGLQISYPNTYYIQQNNDLAVRFWVYNYSNGAILTNSTVNCTYNLLNNTGYNIVRQISSTEIKFGRLGLQGCQNCFNTIIGGGNFTSVGSIYSYQIRCQATGNLGGYELGNYEITDNGRIPPGDNNIIFMSIIFIIIIVSLLFFLIYDFGHMVALDFDIMDLAYNYCFYFGIFAYYQIEQIYLGNIEIEYWLTFIIDAGGLIFIIIPTVAFILTLTLGSLANKDVTKVGALKFRRQKSNAYKI